MEQKLPADLDTLGFLSRQIDDLGKRFQTWAERQESISRQLLAASDSHAQILQKVLATINSNSSGSGGGGFEVTNGMVALARQSSQNSSNVASPPGSPQVVSMKPKVGLMIGDESPGAESFAVKIEDIDESVTSPTSPKDMGETFVSKNSATNVRAFPLRDLWASSQRRTKRFGRSESNQFDQRSSQADEAATDPDESQEICIDPGQKGWWTPFIAMPGSRYRLSWDLFGGLLIAYDMFLIPLQAFQPPPNTFTDFMEMTTLYFWTLNVAATLTAGYIRDGVLVMNPKTIILNYLKGWFIVDAVVLIPDYAFMIIASSTPEGGGGGQSSVKMLRWLRLARTIRLIRLLKLKWIMDAVNDYLDSEYSSIILSIVKMLVMLFILCHFICCIWFLLASIQDGDTTWVNFRGEFDESPWDLQYLVALHWAITQFTPASMHVQPQNKLERTYAILIVFFALVGFAYIVGSITGSIGQLRAMGEQVTKDFWLLRRYLKKNQVPQTLSLRITKFVEHVHAHSQSRMSMDQVRLLKSLSRQLKEELHCAINLPHINIHPLFATLGDRSMITMNRVACDSVSHSHLARGDTMFQADQRASHMYFISSGLIRYTRDLDGEEDVAIVEHDKGWISEPVLWTKDWFHVGEANAGSEVEVLLMSPKHFEEILSSVKSVACIASEYGRQLIAWILTEEHLNDVIQGDEAFAMVKGFITEG